MFMESVEIDKRKAIEKRTRDETFQLKVKMQRMRKVAQNGRKRMPAAG